MPGVKTNERPGTRAVLRHYHMSATKARAVLDLVRGEDVQRAAELLRTTEREAAVVIGKVLASAVANAVHNDGQDAEDLYISACYADDAGMMKRWRPRARGRASRIRKRSCHITVIVSRMPDERLARQRAQREALGAQRSRRVAESRRRADLAGRLGRRRAAQAEAAEAEALEAAEAEAAEADGDEVTDDAAEAIEVEVAEAAAAADAEVSDAAEDDADGDDADDDADDGTADTDGDADAGDEEKGS